MRVLHTLREALATARDLFYPAHCAGCGRALEQDEGLCDGCRSGAQRIKPPRCEVCSHVFHGAMDHFVCPNCRGEPFAFECAVSAYRFHGIVRDLIHRLKYGRESHLRRVLGEWLWQGLEDERLSGYAFDVIVAVPVHSMRKRERGFDQAELLAQWLAERTGISYLPALARIRYTRTQTQFDRKLRMRNLRGAFRLRQNADVTDQQILLVDDVLTTGSTLDNCAQVLLEEGAKSVRAITVARG